MVVLKKWFPVQDLTWQREQFHLQWLHDVILCSNTPLVKESHSASKPKPYSVRSHRLLHLWLNLLPLPTCSFQSSPWPPCRSTKPRTPSQGVLWTITSWLECSPPRGAGLTNSLSSGVDSNITSWGEISFAPLLKEQSAWPHPTISPLLLPTLSSSVAFIHICLLNKSHPLNIYGVNH